LEFERLIISITATNNINNHDGTGKPVEGEGAEVIDGELQKVPKVSAPVYLLNKVTVLRKHEKNMSI
jgi:hypothetical protein